MKRFLSAIGIATLTLTACSTSSDGESGCTLLACYQGLQVSFAASSWPAGAYRLDVTADGLVYNCETRIPLDAANSVTCSSPNLMLMVSGSALPVEQQAITGMQLSLMAEQVELTLSRDGLPLATSTLFPQYVETQPNGPGCEPVCQSASASLEI